MKLKYKPGNKSGVTTADAKLWYKSLDFIESKIVDSMIDRYIAYVKARSKSPASRNMGIELIYKVMMKMDLIIHT